MIIQIRANPVIFITAVLVCFGSSAFCENSPFAKFKQILELPEVKREVAVESLKTILVSDIQSNKKYVDYTINCLSDFLRQITSNSFK